MIIKCKEIVKKIKKPTSVKRNKKRKKHWKILLLQG